MNTSAWNSMDVDSTKSQMTESVHPFEGLMVDSQTGLHSLNGPSTSVSVSAPEVSPTVQSLPPSASAINALPTPSTHSASSQEPLPYPGQMMKINPPMPEPELRTHEQSSSVSTSGSYNSLQTQGGLHDGRSFLYSTNASGDGVARQVQSSEWDVIELTGFSDSQLVRNTIQPAGPIYPPVANQYVHPHNYVPGTALPSMQSPAPTPNISFPRVVNQHSAINASHGVQSLESLPSNIDSSVAVTHDSSYTTATTLAAQSFPLPHQNSFGLNVTPASSPHMRPGQAWPHVASGNPATVPVNSVQQQMFSTHLMPVSPIGHWLQTSQTGIPPRPPFLPFPSNFQPPFSGNPRGIPLASFPSLSSQPPRVNTGALSNAPAISSSVSGLEFHNDSGIMVDQPPRTDGSKDVVDIKRTVDNEHSNAWTSHKTETGVVYYYNALTGESTYDRPSGFKELSIVNPQPAPASCEKMEGTDWVSVTTNDGKKYYYNSKSKLSSWQIPVEVMEMRKQQDGEHSTAVPNDTPIETSPPHLETPAIDSDSRDAMPWKSLVLPPSSSTLDSIKKKLQDSVAVETLPLIPSAAVLETPITNGSIGDESSLQNVGNKDKPMDCNANNTTLDSSSESDDPDSGPTKEQCIIQFKDMLKERGVAPFSKWDKELPKIVFDPRFKAIPSHSLRRSLFDHYVKTRAEEERKEKRAAQKAAIEGFKQLLQEASEDIDHNTDYSSFKRKWGDDPRFKALNYKEREILLNERITPLRKAAEEQAQAIRAEAASIFKSMLKERNDINTTTRWSKVKDALRNDPRYKSVKHEDREILFNEYISDLKAADEKEEREAKAKRQEQDKLRERERELRKRKVREEEEIERMRLKVRRKEAVSAYQALLVEIIKDPQASWTESRPKLEKDPQGRAINPDLNPAELEKLFREHVNALLERHAHEFKALLGETLTAEVAASQESKDGKTVFNSWSTAKELLKNDPRYIKMPRKEREVIWRRYSENMQRKHAEATAEENEDRNVRSDSSKSRRGQDRRQAYAAKTS